jgi:ADP-ribose pyrophosphatase YjhB (NUDIX family)
MTTWRTRIEPYTRPLFFAWSRISRGMTLGVRGVVVDSEGRVLLVKHTYLHGWWLPGGGVERGQTCEAALIREMHEEAGLIVEGRPTLISIHANERFFRGDHVLVYRIDHFSLTERTSHGEIAETGWFDPARLPEDTHRATRDRLGELFDARETSGEW